MYPQRADLHETRDAGVARSGRRRARELAVGIVEEVHTILQRDTGMRTASKMHNRVAVLKVGAVRTAIRLDVPARRRIIRHQLVASECAHFVAARSEAA
ncbi:hypothetical protein D3C73_1071340 [compost metagenome]